MKEFSKVSFIEKPISSSVLYVGKKLEDKLELLSDVSGCKVFVEEGVSIPSGITQKHEFVVSKNPELEYALFVKEISGKQDANNRKRKYTLTEGNYFIGENVSLGKNVHIDPGVIIGHDVAVGDESNILAGSVVKNAIIGKACIIKENAVIGGQAFTFTKDENDNNYKTPCLGWVKLDDYVSIGSFSTICRGLNTATTIGAYAKLDDHVHVGHDAVIGSGSVITAGVIMGGYVQVGKNVRIGMNATIRHMVSIADDSVLPMCARVGKDITDSNKNYGFPRKP